MEGGEAVKHEPFQPTYFNTNAHFVRSKLKFYELTKGVKCEANKAFYLSTKLLG
jgi:hypothetical protein